MFKFSALRHFALASTLLLGLVYPAQASLNETISGYPDDTLAMFTVSLDLKHWGYISSKLAQGGKVTVKDSSDKEAPLPNEVNDILKFLNDDLNFNPVFDGLLNIGSHLTAAYRPYPGSKGHVFFSLNFRSGERIQKLLQNLDTKLKEQGMHSIMAKENFGPTQIFRVDIAKLNQSDDSDAPSEEVVDSVPADETAVPEEEEQDANLFGEVQVGTFDQLFLAVSGNNLIGCMGPNADVLKQMLYSQSILPATSRFKLSNNSYYQPVQDALQDKAAWLYVDLKQATSLLETFGVDAPEVSVNINQDEESEDHSEHESLSEDEEGLKGDLAFLNELTSMYRGLGIGFEIQKEGIQLHSFISHDLKDLNAIQLDYLNALKQTPSHSLKGIIERSPGEAVFFTAGQHLNTVIEKPFPVDLKMDDLPFKQEDVNQALAKIFNIDYKTDFLPLIDGRYGFGVYDAPGSKTPHMILYLGLKDGKETDFDRVMQQKFEINQTAIENIGDPESEVTQVQQNMLDLRAMLSSYSAFESGYPVNVEKLIENAQANDYYMAFNNPVTNQTGIGASLKDFTGMGQNADVNLAGTVFYEALDVSSDQDGNSTASAYAIYGYDPNGMLYKLSDSSDTYDFETILETLPKTEIKPASDSFKPKLIETWQNTPIYSFGVDIPKDDLPMDINPVFARKGNVWMLGLNPDALKAAIQGKNSSKINHWVEKTASQDASSLFYLNMDHLGVMVAKIMQELGQEDKEFGEFVQIIKPWHSLFASSIERTTGTEGQMNFDIDMDQIDVKALMEIFKDSSTDPEYTEESSEEDPKELSDEDSANSDEASETESED